MTGGHDAWAVVAAALGAALLTSTGAGYLDRLRSKREGQSAKEEALRLACERFVGAALALTQRSGVLFQTMHLRSGLPESLDIVLHYKKPLDPMALGDWILQDVDVMFNAQTVIWFLGSDRLIKEAGDALAAAAAVIAASSHLTEAQRVKPIRSWRDIGEIKRRLTPLKVDPDTEAARVAAVVELGRALRRFAATMRKELGTPDPDALLRNFPAPTGDELPS